MELINKKKAIYFYLQSRGGEIGFKGKSMLPVIKEGFRIKIDPVEISNIAPGDVIAFDDRDKIVIHRVVGKIKKSEKLFFVEKGDNSPLIRIRPAEEVIGEVQRIISPPITLERKLWKRKNSALIICCYVLCFIYSGLSGLKRNLFKDRIIPVSKYLHVFYWKTCFSIIRVFFCRKSLLED